jgi:hypothetical protein
MAGFAQVAVLRQGRQRGTDSDRASDSARPQPESSTVSSRKVYYSAGQKRNFKLNLKYGPVITVPSTAVTPAY